MNDHWFGESVLDVWILWAMSLALMTGLLFRGIQRFRWATVSSFWRDEEGASYTLPYVLCFPIVMLIFCIIIQATLILLVKFGTVHAAYAAARAVIVWQASDPEDAEQGQENAQFYADRAAMLAMTPFASGYTSHLERIFPGVLAQAVQTNRIPKAGLATVALDRIFNLYTGMYERLGNQSSEPQGHSPIITNPNQLAKADYVRNKLLFAAMATTVEFPESPAGWNDAVSVKVQYRMPMHIPGTVRVFADETPGAWLFPKYFVRKVTTTVTLPSEAAETSSGQLGVPYFPAQLSRYSLDETFDQIWNGVFD